MRRFRSLPSLFLLAVATIAPGCGGEVDDANPWSQEFHEEVSSPPPPCGDAIGSFNGTNARSNGKCQGTLCSCAGTVTYGLGYQCVELPNRYWVTHGLGARVYGNAGEDACRSASGMSDYVVHRPGSTVAPVPGDALEWENSANTGGHVALVTSNSGGSITFLQQNAGTTTSYYPHGTVSWDGTTFGHYGSSLRPVCWIHAKKNGASNTSSGAACYSSTLAKDVSSGVCVQAASDGKWYHCDNGSWIAGEAGCTTSYPWCDSATLGRTVPARSCVHSKFDGREYQCVAHGAWGSPVTDGAGPIGTCSAEYN